MGKLLFNVHDVVLLMTAGLTVVMAISLLTSRGRRQVDVVLAAFIVTQGLTSLCYLFLYNAVFSGPTVALLAPFEFLPLTVLYYLQGVLLLTYSRGMAGESMMPSKNDKILLAIVVGIPSLMVVILRELFDGNANPSNINIAASNPALAISVYYGFLALVLVRKHNREIRHHFSNIDEINLIWLGYSTFGFVALWCVRLFNPGPIFHNYELARNIALVANYLPLFLVSWMVIVGIRHKQRIVEEPVDQSNTDKHQFDPELVNKLEDLMCRVKVNQDTHLSLEGLADSLDVSPRSASALINGHYNQSFYDFINGYRVSEAEQILGNPQQKEKPIQQVFEDVGFRSKSTFNAIFKKITGQTPTEYRRFSLNPR
ncbi:MAG: helix-turn-helix domain-containing protein [Pseudomonadota bacterium]